MGYKSCFDIIGPIMVGPSSSHTAGATSIGYFAYQQLGGVPEQAEITLYDSFAATYKGHGTDKAVVAGLLGFTSGDLRIRKALEIAREKGVQILFKLEDICPFYDHPNTVLIQAERGDRSVTVGGVSLGGGLSKICLLNQAQVDLILEMEILESELVR